MNQSQDSITCLDDKLDQSQDSFPCFGDKVNQSQDNFPCFGDIVNQSQNSISCLVDRVDQSQDSIPCIGDKVDQSPLTVRVRHKDSCRSHYTVRSYILANTTVDRLCRLSYRGPMFVAITLCMITLSEDSFYWIKTLD